MHRDRDSDGAQISLELDREPHVHTHTQHVYNICAVTGIASSVARRRPIDATVHVRIRTNKTYVLELTIEGPRIRVDNLNLWGQLKPALYR